MLYPLSYEGGGSKRTVKRNSPKDRLAAVSAAVVLREEATRHRDDAGAGGPCVRIAVPSISPATSLKPVITLS